MTKFKPINGLVMVMALRHETARAVSALAVAGVTRSEGFFLAKILALPDPAPPDLVLDAVVVVEAQSAVFGGSFQSEELGLPPGDTVHFVYCRQLPVITRSAELAERLRDVQRIQKTYPDSDFPKTHPFWKSDKGEAVLAQLGQHKFEMQTIMAERKGKRRDRLLKRGSPDAAGHDGIIGIWDGALP